jgi:hypothetical protein
MSSINPSQSKSLRGEQKKRFQPNRKGRLIWYPDGSKTKEDTGAGMCCYRTRQKLSLSLGQYTTIFQAEVYATKPCAVENLDKNYKHRNIYTVSDSQAAIRALENYQINSKLVWDFFNCLYYGHRHNK